MSSNDTTKQSNAQGIAVMDFQESQPRISIANEAKPKAASTNISATDDKMSVVVVRDVEGLKARLKDWQALADEALEPNCSYEPWMLVPAVGSLAANADLYLVFVYAPDRLRPFGAKILCGVFPLQLSRRYKNLPVSVLRLWKHDYCFLCTPLLKAGGERETLSAFFDWLESHESPAILMEFSSIAGDGAFHQLLLDELNHRASLSFVEERYNRALLRQDNREGLSGRHKKELRRQQNRLAEEGLLEYVALEGDAALDCWIKDFLELEASGWKGQQQSAFASEESSRRFFEAAVKAAFAEKQLMMLALRLNGRPIAMKCNFLTGRGAFAFKIAFDETYSRYSPGVLLELENMRRVQANPTIEWMDSCAVSEHFMINRLWSGRRTIETLLVSTGKRPADFVVAMLPVLRWFKRKLWRKTAKS